MRGPASPRCTPETLSSIVNRMPDALVTLDREWRFTFVNDRAAEMMAESRDELVGRTIWEASPELAESSVGAELRRAMHQRISISLEAPAAGNAWNEVHAFPAEEEGLGVLFSDITARKEAERDALRLFGTTRLLLDAAQELTSQTDPEKTLEAFADALLRVVPHTRIAVAEYDESRREATVLFSKGKGAFVAGSIFPAGCVSRPALEALESRRPVVIDYDRLPDDEAGAARGNRARLGLVVPLIAAGRSNGLVFMDTPGERIDVNARDLDVLQGIASQAATVIENARLYAVQRETARLAEALNAIDHSIHSTLAVQDIFGRVVSEAAVALGCESAAMGTREGDGWVLRYEFQLGKGLIGRRFSDEDLRIARLACDRQEVVAVDNAFEYQLVNPETRRAFDARSFLVVPLVARDEVVGVIYFIYHSRLHRFTPAEVDFGRRLSVSLGLAIANATAYRLELEAEQHAQQELNASTQLLRASAALAEPLELDRVLDVLAGVLLRTVGHARTWVHLWDESRRLATVAASAGEKALPVGTTFRFEDLSPETQRVVTERRTLVVDYDALPPERRGQTGRLGSHISLFVPMVQKDHLAGVVAIDDPGERREFTDREIATTEGIAAQAAVAVENARLYEASRRELARTTVLREVAAAASEHDMRAVGVDVLETVTSRLGARAGVVYRLEEEERLLREIALRGYPVTLEPLFAEVPLDETSITGQAVLRDRLLTLSYDQLPEATRRRAEAAGEAASYWTAVPAHSHGRRYGAITLTFEAEHRLDDEDVALFDSLGDQLGVALERAQLFETEQQRARLGEEIASIDRSLHETLSAKQILEKVSELAAKALAMGTCRVLIRENGRWFTRGGYNVPRIVQEEGTFTDEQVGVFMNVLREGRVLAIADSAHDPRADRDAVKRLGIVSSLIAPLAAPGVEGVLVFNSFTEPRRFDQAEIQFAGQVATSLALALANARRYESERGVAETLQSALLALPETIPGIEFAHLYRSATEAVRVGGDFYDLFELAGGRVGITVGDISGHGIDAAVLTSLVKNTIRVQATQEDKPPNAVMAVANTILFDNSPADIFATVFFGVLDLAARRLDYCNAGHTTAACVCPEHGVSGLPANSPLTGAFADARFELSTERLDVCDLLFLYTDGLTEARRGRELFGEERLFALLAHQGGGRPEEVLREVIGDALAFTGGQLSDDLAVLALRQRRPADRLEADVRVG